MSPPDYKLPKNPSPYFVCFLAASCLPFPVSSYFRVL